MTSVGIWDVAIGGGSAGFGMGLVFVMVRWSANFLAGRLDKKEAQLDAGTQRLIAGLQQQIEALTNREDAREQRLSHVEDELAECRRLHAESEADRMRLNAMLLGMGDARQHAQLIVSAEKRKETKG